MYDATTELQRYRSHLPQEATGRAYSYACGEIDIYEVRIQANVKQPEIIFKVIANLSDAPPFKVGDRCALTSGQINGDGDLRRVDVLSVEQGCYGRKYALVEAVLSWE